MSEQKATISLAAKGPLSVNESALRGFNYAAQVLAEDINNSQWTGDGDTVKVEIVDASGKGVRAAMIVVKEAFTTDGTLTAKLGGATDDDSVIAAQDVKSAGVKSPVAGFVPATAAGGVGEKLYLTFATQASTGAPADIKSGRLLIYLQLV